jgi:glycosyltransferase involved in cell wall biosynthesis
MDQRPLILVYVNHTLSAGAPSGIQRVVRKLAEQLPAVAEVAFVTWDYSDGHLRYLDARGLQRLFGTQAWPTSVRPHPLAHRVNFRFGATLPQGRAVWLLMPEVSYHGAAGTAVISRIVSMCREYGVRTAAIFYDAIPITNASYRNLKALHAAYTTQIARCDRIYAISQHSRRELARLYTRMVDPPDPQLQALLRRIVAVPLGEADQVTAAPAHDPAACKRILLLGTIEPRKGQVRVLRAFKKIDAAIAGDYEVHIAGSLHPDVADAFNALVASCSRFRYHGYMPAADAEELFAGVRFSVFASEDEGFGLPIAESLARGIPCLTANFGAMAETARGGGCLTTDVRDVRPLTDAMKRLMQDDVLLARLQAEIAARKLRTWRDYASDLAADMLAASEEEAAAERRMFDSVGNAIEASFAGGQVRGGVFPIELGDEDSSLSLIVDAGTEAAPAPPPDRTRSEFRVVVCRGASAGGADEVARAACASAVIADSADALRTLVERAGQLDCGDMLPATCVVEGDGRELIEVASRAVARELWLSRRRRALARREHLMRRLASRSPGASDTSLPLLSIVISTYNRARFVEVNVRWLLRVLARFAEDIRLIVVDNASTDDTLDRLEAFARDPRLTVISNPVNVGMLGNLRVCAGLILSRYVWITGDDDFILPEGLAEVIDALSDHPEIPFAFVNFGIYHRAHFGPDDTVEKLVAERAPLAARPIRSGVYPVARIAEQHDNLFTAFYPIVFRSDLLAACFDHPFDGRPFVDLVESVPTTKMLLESYASTEAYWCARMATVGNICNSWSRHRPRWHAVLMPRVFQLAREVGVDPARLHAWSKIHLDLFDEARQRAHAEGVPLDVRPDELDASYRVFRQPISLA